MPAHLSSINWMLPESSVDDSDSGFDVIPVCHRKVWIVSGEGRGVKYELPRERVRIFVDKRRGFRRHNVPPEQEAKRMPRSAAVTSGRE